MAKRSILLADPDPRSLQVLEVSLRNAGYLVASAQDGEEALALARAQEPDLVVCDVRLPKLDGHGLVRALRDEPALAQIPVVLLLGAHAVEDKIRGLELGVDDFLTKPVFVRELLSRASVLLARRARDVLRAGGAEEHLAGTTDDLPLVDLLQTLEAGKKTGEVVLRAGAASATFWLRDGRLVDAELGALRGEEAVFRALVWKSARFDVALGPVEREERIAAGLSGLLLEGMRRSEEWERMREQLPDLGAVFRVDHEQLVERLGEIPDELNGILRLVDGARTLAEIVDVSPFDDLSTMQTLSKLHFEGLLVQVDESAPRPAPLSRFSERPTHPEVPATSSGDIVHLEPEDVESVPLTPPPRSGLEPKGTVPPSPLLVSGVGAAVRPATDDAPTPERVLAASAVAETEELVFRKPMPSVDWSEADVAVPATKASTPPPPPPSAAAADDDEPPVVAVEGRIPGRPFALGLVAIMVLSSVAIVSARRSYRGTHDNATDLTLARDGGATPSAPAPSAGLPATSASVARTDPSGAPAPSTVEVPTPLVASAAPPSSAEAPLPAVPPTAPPQPPDAPPAEPRPPESLAAAQRALERGDAAHALDVARRITQRDASNAEAWLTMGAAYEALGSRDRATRTYRRCAEQAQGPRVAECRALAGE